MATTIIRDANTSVRLSENSFGYDELEAVMADPSTLRAFRVIAGTALTGHFGGLGIEVAYVRDSGLVNALSEDDRYSDLFVEREIAPGRTEVVRF